MPDSDVLTWTALPSGGFHEAAGGRRDGRDAGGAAAVDGREAAGAGGAMTGDVLASLGAGNAAAGVGDLGEVVRLAGRCLAVDGGLPTAADPAFLRGRWAVPGTTALVVRDGAGVLRAAGAVRPAGGGSGVTFVGLVDPDVRGRGVGARLLDWGLAEAARRGGPVTVETESLTAAAERLFASRGLRQIFAEDVMRIDLDTADLGSAVPGVPVPHSPVLDVAALEGAVVEWPPGTSLLEWSEATAPRFHAVYEAAFRERPGFPGWSAEEWISDVAEDDEFRPHWSLLASIPGLTDPGAGFVTAAVGWIVQVGVVPAARGKGLGAALIRESLGRMCADGAREAWLNVNVNNPASRLYRRMAFEDRGRRARYQPGDD